MRLASKPPLLFLTIALLGLLVLLASLQYVWLGRISQAERDRLQSTLSLRTSEFAQDFDRELTRAYLLFQAEPIPQDADLSTRFAERYDRWVATSTYPRVLRDFYVAARPAAGEFRLQRFDPAARVLQDVPWPASMSDWRTRLNDETERKDGEAALFIRRLPPPIWESVPALVVPSPIFIVTDTTRPHAFSPPEFSYSVLTIDLEYIGSELLPELTRRHFRTSGDVAEYQVAVVENADPGRVVYQSSQSFNPGQHPAADASATLFQVRTQDFGAVAAEVKRFATFRGITGIEREERRGGTIRERQNAHRPTQMSIVVQQGASPGGNAAVGADARRAAPPARWRVTVVHPAGSLEAYVGSTRRRNLIVSTSILAVLGVSMALLIVSTRRSQTLARQQLEFVAAVSHELRTPLAVIRSAGENLADGVVHDEQQIKKYGELIRGEGRRLSDMVEQILELSGIQSGQRGFNLRPFDVRAVVQDVTAASRALIDEACMQVEVDIPDDLPFAQADESAFRRVMQNLISNAIKYGAGGGWLGIKGRADAARITISVSDRGIGIAPAQQGLIFDPFYRTPDVIAARIQGAGLGLSLVRRIVEGHGGQIDVKSVPGQGSEFAVSIPVADANASDRLPASAQTVEPAQSS
jgi:signal transduction histidine kinase